MRSRLPLLVLALAGCGPGVQAVGLNPILEVGYPENGEPPATPYIIDFGAVQAGQEFTQILRVANAGYGTLRVDPISVDAGAFTASQDAAALRHLEEETPVLIHFKPTKKDVIKATFFVTSNAGNREVVLKGSAFECGDLTPVPTPDAKFSWVKPGTTKEITVKFDVAFDGGAPSGCLASLQLPSPFELGPVTPSQDKILPLDAGGKVAITLRYTPTSWLPQSKNLILVYGNGQTALTIRVHANDEDPVHAASTSTVPVEPDLSVLAVLDNSPSVQAVADDGWVLHHLRAAALEEAGTRRVQVGFTSTGIGVDPACSDSLQGDADGRLLPVPASTRIFSVPAFEELLESDVRRLTACHSHPKGLETMARALSPTLLSAEDDPRHPEVDDGNAGFLPEGSDLRIVFLSASDDESPQALSAYVQTVRDLRTGGRRVSVRAVLGGGPGCGTAGSRYADLATQLGGTVEDLCQTSSHARGAEIPPYVVNLQQMALDPTEVKVTVDDVPLTYGNEFKVIDRPEAPDYMQVVIGRYQIPPDQLWFPPPGSTVVMTYDAPGFISP